MLKVFEITSVLREIDLRYTRIYLVLEVDFEKRRVILSTIFLS